MAQKMKDSEADLRRELEERLRFETLLADVSARYINLPADQIDTVIEDDQRRICEFLGLDLSTLWQWEPESTGFITLTHLYTAPGGPVRPERIEAQTSFPWVIQKLQEGETLILSTENMCPEAAVDQKSRRYYGVKSSVVLPLSVGGGSLLGVLTFETLWEEREWPDEIVRRLMLVAQIFSNALARKELDKSLREGKARLALAAESAGAMLWELEMESGHLWTTDQGKEFFGFAPDSELTLDGFLRVVHPEDREVLRRKVAETMRSGKDNRFEYRIVLPDGHTRWVLSRGRPYPAPAPRMMGVTLDITERRLFEERILDSEARLATAIDVAGLGFYEIGYDMRVKCFDDRLLALLGITPADEEHGREFWLAHIHPEDFPRIQDQIQRMQLERVDQFKAEYRYLHPEHGMIWLNHFSRVIERNAAGRPTRNIGVMQDITERKQKEEILIKNEAALKDSQKDLRRLAGRLISVQEEELRRLSRELHDDLTQRLVVLAIEAGKLERRGEKSEHALPYESLLSISRIKEQLISVSEDVHRISRQLHPTILDDLGLVRAMGSECAALQLRENLEVVFQHENVPDGIPKDIALCLYRVVQEGLKNIVRHSGAARCDVVLRGGAEALSLTIQDQGKGFDREEVRNKPGLGLSSMRERVQLVRGDFGIDSRPGEGTVIRVRVPLTKEKT
jgi:PAS domain S-box-containing protein